MPRNFLLEPLRREADLTSIKGEIAYIFQPNDRYPSIFQGPDFSAAVLAKLNEIDFDCGVDKIVFTGPAWPLGVLMYVLNEYMLDTAADSITVLVFDSRANDYTEVKIEAFETIEEEDDDDQLDLFDDDDDYLDEEEDDEDDLDDDEDDFEGSSGYS